MDQCGKVGPRSRMSSSKFYGLEASSQMYLWQFDSPNDSPLSNAWRMALSISLDDPRPPILNSNTVIRSRFFKVSFTISQWVIRFFFPKFSSTWFRISASTDASNIVCVLSKRTTNLKVYFHLANIVIFFNSYLPNCWKLWFTNKSVLITRLKLIA